MKELADELSASDSPANAFAEAAEQHSESASATDGGRVGWVSGEGDLPPEVIEAVRQTAVCKVSDPVQSKLGLHLILVHAIEAGTQTFNTLTDQAALRRDAADALFNALVDSQSSAKVKWFVEF